MAFHAKKCKASECPFHTDRPEVPYEGPRQADIMIVGESPGFEEDRVGRPFSGISGRFLMALLQHIGKERGDVILANAARCHIKKDVDSVKNQNLALRTCRTKLAAVIQAARPKIVIALGGVALKQLTGLQKIMENRGKFFDSTEFNTKIFATVHPAWVLRQGARENFWNLPLAKMNANERLLFMDFEQVQKFLKDEHVGLDTANYKQGTMEDLDKLEKADVLAVDFETTGLDIERPETRVLSVGFSAEEGKSIVFLANKQGTFHPRVLRLLENPKITKVVAARPFEERICKKLGIEMPGKEVHDVLAMAHLLDENFTGGYSLERVADLYTGLKNIKSLSQGQRASLEELSKEDLIKYNGVDCDATLRAFHAMRNMLAQDEALSNYYVYFTQRMQAMFADLYSNGCKINTKALGKGERELTAIADGAEAEALSLIPESIKTDPKHAGKLRLSRDELVRDYLFTHPDGKQFKPNPNYLTPKGKKPQISEDHLKQFKGKFIENYLRMKKARKITSTYMRNLWTQIAQDGKVYPNTIFTRTVTGRTVMTEPAIQTIPQRGEFAGAVKKAFVADPGWTIGSRDLAQSEIRIVGWLAQDPNILGALATRVDVHTKTAAVINRIPIEQVTKDQRQKAKACIAEGQLVPVSSITPPGYRVPFFKPIEQVLLSDYVWDGEQWVAHCGVVDMGVREVIQYDGLVATPDHTVFLERGGYCHFSEAKAEKALIAVGDVACLDIRNIDRHRYGYYSRKASPDSNPVPRLWKDRLGIGRQSTLWPDKDLSLPERSEVRTGSKSTNSRGSLRRDLATDIEPGQSLLRQLRRTRDTTTVPIQGAFYFVDDGELAPSLVQGSPDRPPEQQWTLRPREPEVSISIAQLDEQENERESSVQGDSNQREPSMARAEIDSPFFPFFVGVDVEISEEGYFRGSHPDDGTQQAFPRMARVYDILNAGPRHRFTVSGKIVSNCNFGFIYGMSAKKFQGYAKDEYGINLTLDQCEAVRQAFFAHPSGYYKLLDFHRKQENEAITKGRVRSPLGRIRKLPNAQQQRDRMAMGEALRQGINFPVQSFSSDLGLIGMYLFWRWVKRNGFEDRVKVMWFIHDAIIFQARDDFFPRAMKKLKWCMEEGSVKYVKKYFGVDVGYPVESDGKAGISWAGLQEYCDTCGTVKVLGRCSNCKEVQRKKAEEERKKESEQNLPKIHRTLVVK